MVVFGVVTMGDGVTEDVGITPFGAAEVFSDDTNTSCLETVSFVFIIPIGIGERETNDE